MKNWAAITELRLNYQNMSIQNPEQQPRNSLQVDLFGVAGACRALIDMPEKSWMK